MSLTSTGGVIGIIAWGNLVGSLSPIGLRSLKLDPATISAPFPTTFTHVTGLVICFSFARAMLNRQGHGRAASETHCWHLLLRAPQPEIDHNNLANLPVSVTAARNG
ncbi:magnesium transporter [Halochromatium glycolicum]|uniref:SLC41A/MgtE integral membrane domain-containing protein n=1 Tax=Halochromatium glycolicum TaxID=85075 RepID=A0AAJ0XCM5_9GAMM|nr:magnesium transporter [Halochromatium glycolicum]MBK1707002.1 hypothetical protein [Halochromatium glycolicum]